MKKRKMSLDTWVDMPHDMKKYLQNYGYHFNHKMYKFAASKMYKKSKEGKEEKIEPVEKEKVQVEEREGGEGEEEGRRRGRRR